MSDRPPELCMTRAEAVWLGLCVVVVLIVGCVLGRCLVEVDRRITAGLDLGK